MEKVWLKSYPQGVPALIDPSSAGSLVTMFEENCQRFSSRPAFSNLGTTLSYAQVYQKARAFAAYLQQVWGFKKGDRLAIVLPNLLQYPVALFGALMAGAVVVNVNPVYTVSEMQHQLKDAEVKAVLMLKNFASVLEKVLEAYPIDHVILTEIGDLCGWPKAWLINAIVKWVKRKIPAYQIPQAVSFNQVLSQGAHLTFEDPKLTQEDIAFLQYTGGTTGVAKGAVLTHRNMVANVLQVQAWVLPFIELGKEVMLTALPVYHIFCLQANLLTFMRIGAHNVLITDPRNIKALIKTMMNIRCTTMTGVNTLFNSLVGDPSFVQVDFSHFKIALGGGMPVQEAVSQRWQAITGVPLVEGYGLTEASPVIAIHPLNVAHFVDAAGLPVPSTEIKIMNELGQALGLNETGELWVRGPQVMREYWRQPEETRQVLTEEGWLATGDMACVDEQGFIHILERKKDMINVSGFNVYPTEIEAVIADIPQVKEVAVISIPDVHSGEGVKALIVKRDETLTQAQVIAHCRQRLTHYKRPKVIEFVSNLPKTPVGKILRRALR